MARRNDHTREEIRRMSLDAAEAIVGAEGAEALSVRRIARAIGYTHGTLYLVFGSIDGLLLELERRTLAELADAIAAATRAAPPGVARLHALATAYLRFANAHRERWRLAVGHRIRGSASPEGQRRAAAARAVTLVEAALAEAGAPSRAAGAALWASIHGIVAHTVDGGLGDGAGAPVQARRALEACVEAFWRDTRRGSETADR